MRRHHRSESTFTVQVAWRDRAGQDNFTRGRGLNLSEAGVQIEVPHRLEIGAYITFTSSKPGLQGSASVRSCVRRGTQYAVGLEFSGGLKWKPTNESGPK